MFPVACYISILGSTVGLKLIKRLEEGNDALIITKETTKLTKLRVPGLLNINPIDTCSSTACWSESFDLLFLARNWNVDLANNHNGNDPEVLTF